MMPMLLHPKIRALLKERGIEKEDDIKELLSSKPQKTYDPFLMKGMKEGVDFLLERIGENKKICIYGDYDADGITSIAILYSILSRLTDNLTYYIPSRFNEGYGLNKESLKKLRGKGVDVILTVDLGSTSHKEIEYGKTLGLEFLITDHHTAESTDLGCIFINPKQEDCTYPFKYLAGCGVAYKLAQGLQRKSDLPKSVINELLDVLCIGTVGDIVPLVDENRTFVKYGLQKINENGRKSIVAIREAACINEREILAEHISFIIAPLINSAGRLEDAKTAYEVLVLDDEVLLKEEVARLLALNRLRKELQEEGVKKLVSKIEVEPDNLIHLVYDETVHEGVAGIIAGKLKDMYERPVCVITPFEEGVKGTARSVKGINLYNLLKKNEGFFKKFGGHAMACGFTMEKEDIEALKEKLNEDLEEFLDEFPETFIRDDKEDLNMEINEIDMDFIDELNRLGPFGEGWRKPSIKIHNISFSDVYRMGMRGRYFRFKMRDGKGGVLRGVCFRNAELLLNTINQEDRFTVTGAIEINEFNSSKALQFNMEAVQRED